ncbi:hypothetical protein JL721_4714 [Aureococcus anophagefferens]|nr:hypothetical protein JL721_4714 [Aureococcus anophagefferens]
MRPFLGRRRALLALLTFALASGWAPQHSAAKHPRRLLGVRGVEAPNPPTSKARRTRARPPMLTQWTAPRGSAAEGADGGYLETLTKKVQQSLLANSLEIQVPGPGAKREGAFFEGGKRRPRALPINADLLNWRAKRALRRGQLREARALWRRPTRCFWERRGRRDDALAELKLAVDYDPGHGASWVAMARLLTRDVRDAPLPLNGRDQRRRGREEEDWLAGANWNSLAEGPRRGDLARVEEARRCYAKALEAQPRSYFALSAFGDLEARLGNLEERRGLGLPRARELYEVARRAHRSNTRVFTAWAAAEARAGNATGATKLLAMATRAGGLSPGGCRDGNVYATLGDVLQRDLLDCDRAADAFRRAVAVDRAHAPAYYKWATMEARRGDVELASDLLQQGIWGCSGVTRADDVAKLHRAKGELEANATLALKQDAWMHVGAAAALTDDDLLPAAPWDAAADGTRASFRKALDASANAATFAAWARFEANLGEADRARALLEDGIRTCGGDPKIWREYVAFEQRTRGDRGADYAKACARGNFRGLAQPSAAR